MKILLVEDDDLVAHSLVLALRASGYVIERVSNGADALVSVTTGPFDLILLDIGLGEMDGLQFLKEIRTRKVSTPTLILTARDSYEDRIAGLDSGANDYVIKPFHLGELEARIRALLRGGLSNATTVRIGQLTFDTVHRVVKNGDEIVELSPREYAVLEILIHNIGSLVSKQKIAGLLSDWDDPVTNNAVDIIIHRLRRKVERYGVKLQTIRGLGFLVEP